MKLFLMLFILTFLSFVITLLPSIAYAFPGWDNINTIYYNSLEDDVTNKFLLQAANELKTNLENVSLKTFTIINTTTATPPAIFLINDSSHPQLTGKNDESFWLYTNSSGVYIIGKTPIAVRHGAYTLLEKLGFRWFFKNPMWKVKPNSLISLDGLNEVQEPAFIYRLIWTTVNEMPDPQSYRDWHEWNRIGGAATYNAFSNYNAIIPTSEAATNPTWFCYNAEGKPRQLNVTNPEVIEKAKQFAISQLSVSNPRWTTDLNDYLFPASVPMSPNDDPGWNSCFAPNDYQLITDNVIGFANQAAKAVRETLGEKKYVGVYSYAGYSCTPNIALEPNLLVEVTTAYGYCNVPVDARVKSIVSKGAMVGIYDYYVWVSSRENPPSTRRLASEIQGYVSNGVKVITAEGGDGWGSRGLLYYLMSKLYWEPNKDPQVILADFYDKAFGPAKVPIKKYYDLWWTDTIVTENKIGLSFKYLDETEKLAAGNPDVLDRVRFLEYYMRYLWKWQQVGSMTTEQLEDLYKFACNTRNWSVMWFRYIRYNVVSGTLGDLLMKQGLTKTDLDSLCDMTLPTSAQARAWMDEALAAFPNPVEAPDIDWKTLSLVPLGNKDYPKLPAITAKDDRVILVPAKAGDMVTVRELGFSCGIPITWADSNGTVLDTKMSPCNPNGADINFSAPKDDIYQLYCYQCKMDVVSHGASYVVATGLPKRFLYGGSMYLYVPRGTTGLIVGIDPWLDYGYTGTVKLYDPTGNLTMDKLCSGGGACEWGLNNPVPGIWRLDYNGTYGGEGTFLWLRGVPPLLWFDPEHLLVPANAILKLSLLQYRQSMKPIVDGSNITIEIPITFYDKSSTAFTVSKPLWNNTINFRFNESGSVTSINTTYITFTVDPNKNVALLFDIPPPRKTKDIASITNNTFYRKEITISSDNSLVNVTATIDINNSYSNYRLYELQGSTWIDVTSQYALTISDNKAVFSGFSTSDKQFRLEGSVPPPSCIDNDNDSYYAISAGCSLGNDCNDANVGINPGATDICGNSIDEDCSGADLSCPEQPPGGTSSGGSSGGGGGAIVSISAPIEKPITKEPETTSPQQVIESTGTVTMELSAPDTVESGDYYDATVKLLSPIKKTYTLKIAGIQQEISLDAGKEKSVTIPVQAPDAKGAFALTASIDGTTRSKDISLEYKPLVLSVTKTRMVNKTMISITVKNYQPLSTELRIIKDNRQDVFIELIEGQKEYQRQLKLTQPGEYKIVAVATSEGKMIDTDQYLLSVEGKKSFNYGLLLIVAFSFAVIVIMITFLVRPPKIS